MNLVASKIELTLCILKPHVLAAPHVVQEICKIIKKSDFEIVQFKNKNITLDEAKTFYREHTGKFFYNRLVTFMCSGPCGFYVLAKRNAIQDWRNVLGPTKVFQSQFSHPNSLRGLYGLTDTRNAAHGSDSVESAFKEIQVFFPEFDASNWIKINNG